MSKFAVYSLLGIAVFFGAIFAWSFLTQSGREARANAAASAAVSTESVAEPFRTEVKRWLSQRGEQPESMRPAQDWAEGPRVRVESKDGTAYLFYFSQQRQLCSVWTVDPRQNIWNSGNC